MFNYVDVKFTYPGSISHQFGTFTPATWVFMPRTGEQNPSIGYLPQACGLTHDKSQRNPQVQRKAEESTLQRETGTTWDSSTWGLIIPFCKWLITMNHGEYA